MKNRHFVQKNMRIMMALATLSLVAMPIFCDAAEIKSEKTAETAEIISIKDANDFDQMRKNPNGHYRLEADINLETVDWEPIDFYGTLDGQNHIILNTTITSTGKETRTTYDGNFKTYDTHFAGFFGVLENAVVKDVRFVNTRIDLNENQDTFYGGIAGYSDKSEISGCTVIADLNMHVNGKMWGGAGAVGFGNGKFHDNKIDVTMTLTDTDEKNRDESFLGGVLGAGYLDIDKNEIKLDAYLSDAGYVHSGGIVGMYIDYPKGLSYQGSITDNVVDGKITFFENNTDRRAYCEGDIGEIMNWNFIRGNNDISKFVRDEKFDYSQELKPHMCVENPKYEYTDFPPEEGKYGYKLAKCLDCGYEYKTEYSLISDKVEEAPAIVETENKVEVQPEVIIQENEQNNTTAKPVNPVLYYVIAGLLIFGVAVAGVVVLINKK